MSFLKLRNDLALRIVDWGLPASIVRAFIAELERQFGNANPEDVPSSRRLGMNTNVVVADPNDSSKRYIFFIRLTRNDEDFWISDVSCLGVDDANNIFWRPS